MGLFGKKNKIPDGIRVMYYDGELVEFQCNFPCQILLMDSVLRITKINPYIEASLDRSRIISIDIFSEIEYMSKYRGTSIETTKAQGIDKTYFVINYLTKEGEHKHLDFWGTATESLKVMKMREMLMKENASKSYEI